MIVRGMALYIASWVTIEATGTGGAADELGVWFPNLPAVSLGDLLVAPKVTAVVGNGFLVSRDVYC